MAYNVDGYRWRVFRVADPEGSLESLVSEKHGPFIGYMGVVPDDYLVAVNHDWRGDGEEYETVRYDIGVFRSLAEEIVARTREQRPEVIPVLPTAVTSDSVEEDNEEGVFFDSLTDSETTLLRGSIVDVLVELERDGGGTDREEGGIDLSRTSDAPYNPQDMRYQ